jgi:hypothetical protein
MQTRFGRIGGVTVLGAAMAMAVSSAHAAPALRAPEKSLLGISLLGRYSDVLRKFGQPNEIQVGSPAPPAQAAGNAAAGVAGSGMMGGPPPSMMGGSGNMYAQMMRNQGRGMAGAPAGVMGAYGGYGAMMMARQGQGGAPAGGLPGFASPGGVGGGPPPSMMGGSGNMYAQMMRNQGRGNAMFGAGRMGGPAGIAAGANANAVPEAESETTWWYHFPKQGLHYAFLFNKEGRIIQIQQYGWKGAAYGRTRQGVMLGSDLSQVVHGYGWSQDGGSSGKNLVLVYGGREKLAFQLVNNKVVGITLGLYQTPPPPPESEGF